MLIDNDRLRIREYKIYRPNAQTHRKGVLTII